MFKVPTLVGAVNHDDPETLIGTLAPTGGVGPYVVVAIWPAVGDVPDGLVLPLADWRAAVVMPQNGWRAPATLAETRWRGPITLPEADWT